MWAAGMDRQLCSPYSRRTSGHQHLSCLHAVGHELDRSATLHIAKGARPCVWALRQVRTPASNDLVARALHIDDIAEPNQAAVLQQHSMLAIF